MPKITKDQEYTTRDGKPVRIYATDCGGPFPVHGATFQDGNWIAGAWCEDGLAYAGSTYINDLIPKPKTIKVTAWINIYPSGLHIMHADERIAASHADKKIFARRKIGFEVTEGEGL